MLGASRYGMVKVAIIGGIIAVHEPLLCVASSQHMSDLDCIQYL